MILFWTDVNARSLPGISYIEVAPQRQQVPERQASDKSLKKQLIPGSHASGRKAIDDSKGIPTDLLAYKRAPRGGLGRNGISYNTLQDVGSIPRQRTIAGSSPQ